MPPNKDQSFNRAMVVGCAIAATCNYLKLHMTKTLNPPLCNIHAEARELWKRSAMRSPLFDPLPGSPACTHARRLALLLPLRSRATETCNLHSDRCQPVPNFPRLRALALFGSPAASARGQSVIPATKGDIAHPLPGQRELSIASFTSCQRNGAEVLCFRHRIAPHSRSYPRSKSIFG
jgi:hypothetical protein